MVHKGMFFLCLTGMLSLQAQYRFLGQVFESDGQSPLPFAYIILKSNGNGTVSDLQGRFIVFSPNANDTLEVRYLGKRVKNIPVTQENSAFIRIVLENRFYELRPVVVSGFKIKPYERNYMNRVIERSKSSPVNYFQSPLTALYMSYSKEGRQLQKLAKLFQEIYDQEIIDSKLNSETIRRLTADPDLDCERFLKYCRTFNASYVLNHSELEIYNEVMKCYRQWRDEPFQRIKNY